MKDLGNIAGAGGSRVLGIAPDPQQRGHSILYALDPVPGFPQGWPMNMRETNMLILVLALALNVSIAGMLPSDQEPIHPYSANPFYWQYDRKPVLLLGGTDQDILAR